MKRRVFILASVITASAVLGGCSSGEKEIDYVPPDFERYENHIEIDGQWGASAATGEDGQYGIGDPFVMRFNGKYYLYPSTSDPCDGIKVFESEDLVHWTDKGYAVAQSEATVHGAYAPEVVYYNGYFYLCQSRAGKGHYIYRSESPTQGFEPVSKTDGMDRGDLDYGNLGMGIDGSFYVSDEGKLYLLHTSTPAGLKYNEITDPENICTDTVGQTENLGVSGLNGWIEGPGIFRRGSFSYLTYTGNHVFSAGYRIGYSYAENLTDLSSFIQPSDNVTIIDTDEEHYGLGHSSNAVGPNLDSIYTAYHSLVGDGPARRYNVDRYFASGSLLTANGVTHRPVAVPDSADAYGYAEALRKTDGVYAIGSTEGYFTAEYNFVPAQGQELVFGDCRIVFSEGAVALSRKGNTLCRAEINLPADKLVSVRVENGDGVGYIYVNGMRVLTYEAERAEGAVGYTQTEGVGYTAFTNDVFGTSDFEAVKNFPTKFPAATYLKGEKRGYSIASSKRQTGGVRVGEKESIRRIGDAFAVVLDRGDWVKYAVDVGEDSEFLLSAEVSRASAGAEISVTVGKNVLKAKIPAFPEGETETVRVSLGRIRAAKGVQTMKVQVTRGNAEFVALEAGLQENGNVALSEYRAFGDAVSEGNALTVKSGPNSAGAAVFLNSGVSDFEAEITFRTQVDIASNVGFMIRTAHYSQHPSQSVQSWRGYYLQLGSSLLSLRRYDYGDCGSIGNERLNGVAFTGDTHTLVLRAEGHAFTAVLDGKIKVTATDENAFFGGGLGVYAGSGEITVLSLSMNKI